jgi:cysteine-rich repeat protein
VLTDECDDGNNDSGDGCSAVCISEFCGDAIVQLAIGEACDDGNALDGDGCDSNCTVTSCGNGIVTAPEVCDDGTLNSDTDPNASCRTDCTPAGCGDGVVADGETCDEGGQTSTCDLNCTFVQCGDGSHNTPAGERCDDGNYIDGDGCDSNCTPTTCGNGIVTVGEEATTTI